MLSICDVIVSQKLYNGDLLCENCQVFDPQIKEESTVFKCECEAQRNIVFEHIKEHFEYFKRERGKGLGRLC